MNEREIILKAVIAEAHQKPNEKIVLGWHAYTYKEFADMLNTRKLGKEEKKLVENFIKNTVKVFRENEAFKQKMMALAGV